MLELNLNPKEPATTINNSPYDYIAEYIVDLRHPEDPQILNDKYITICGNLDSEMYFDECVTEASITDILPISSIKEVGEKYLPGVYRITLGVKCESSKYWTDCGYEYDAWEAYELLGQYMLTEEEVDVCWNDWCYVEENEQ